MQPEWFRQYLSNSPVERRLNVKGASIAYRHWANKGRPGLIFVHGHAAHSRWWDFIAPAFADDYDIVALDMSGAGDSDHRSQYLATGFAEEIVRVTEHAQLRQATLIGHSFGGAMARIAAYLHPERFAGLVIIDSMVSEQRGARVAPPLPRAKTHYYPSLAEGKRRFRLKPPQPCENKYLIDYIAGHCLKQTAEGWQFKLDPAVFAKMSADEKLPSGAEMVRSMTMPVGFVYGDLSRFFPAEVVSSLEKLIAPALLKKVDAAHHHVFLDQPLAFIKSLRELLQTMSSGAAS